MAGKNGKREERILGRITSPADLKKLNEEELSLLAGEIREKIIDVTSRKGGHIAASLGVVELAVALHYSFESPRDKIVWDVGHQSYAHKILTGRASRFDTLREMGGISGFPNAGESEHDPFTCGHSATSISSALGLAMARDMAGDDYKVAAVIGDASLATGLAFEGMNHAGHVKTDMIVILNDNEHFISKPVGAMSKYLNTVITNPLYNRVRDETERVIRGIPKLGPVAVKTIRKVEEGLKNLIVPGIVFEELGFRYFGPIDGHNIGQLIDIFRKVKTLKGPIFVHAITKKGKGYRFSEEDPVRFHGVDAFDPSTGEGLRNDEKKEKTFTTHFSDKMLALGRGNKKVVAITAAMPDGTGLKDFARELERQFFDVGITEAHAVTFAAGLAKGGYIPVVAIYSTFLQRAYDQIIHDVALQRLPVIFCIDRAGLVGRDGPTHHGVFDIVYMRNMPDFIVMAPKDGEELEVMLEKAVAWGKAAAIRYPRGPANRVVPSSSCGELELGRAEVLRKGKNVSLLAVGSMVNISLKAADMLSRKNIEAEVINARFVKPLDTKLLERMARENKAIFTVEEGISSGGFGSGVLEFFERENLRNVRIKCIGLPCEFIEHGSREELLRKYHLSPEGIASVIESETRRING